MDKQRLERIGMAIARWGCIALFVIGTVHALIVLAAGQYDFEEYGVPGRLQGWNARVAAILELSFFVICGFSVWRSGLFRSVDED